MMDRMFMVSCSRHSDADSGTGQAPIFYDVLERVNNTRGKLYKSLVKLATAIEAQTPAFKSLPRERTTKRIQDG